MRVPVAKVYRAFPELDRFSDQQCERFVKLAQERFQASMTTGAALAIIAFIVVAPVFGLLWFDLLPEILDALGRRPDGFYNSGFDVAFVVTGVCGTPFAGAVAGLYVRDRCLIGVITRQLMSVNCTGCGYSLLGLPVERGRVQCPECGLACDLSERGLTAEDVIAPKAA